MNLEIERKFLVKDLSVIDKIETVSDEQAFFYSKLIASKEGVLVGISSGASLAVAIAIAKENKDKNIVVIMPDSGERYLSTELFN